VNPASMPTLGELLAGVAAVPVAWADRRVQGLATDSRAVQPGSVFFALHGARHHGLEFFDAVRTAGVLAVVWEPPYFGPLPTEPALPLLAAPELRRQLGLIAGRFYGDPSRRLRVVGITGTDGKTSCAHFIAQALSDADSGPCGILGTLGMGEYGRTEPSPHTTPDPLVVQRWLAGLAAEAGVTR
jgi:UDP-N-acetylmuramoyl-L-alanyl-D-glutamate--2,6-diaminopimelate ligase